MSNSNFDNNGLDKSRTHWLQYAAFIVAAFVIYFGWAFFNDTSFHHFAFHRQSFGIVMDITIKLLRNALERRLLSLKK